MLLTGIDTAVYDVKTCIFNRDNQAVIGILQKVDTGRRAKIIQKSKTSRRRISYRAGHVSGVIQRQDGALKIFFAPGQNQQQKTRIALEI